VVVTGIDVTNAVYISTNILSKYISNNIFTKYILYDIFLKYVSRKLQQPEICPAGPVEGKQGDAPEIVRFTIDGGGNAQN